MVRQFHDPDRLSNPKEVLTITPIEVQQGFDVLRSIRKDCQVFASKAQQGGNNAAATQAQSQQSAASTTSTTSQTPLSAENLKAQNAAMNNKAQQPTQPPRPPQQQQQQQKASAKTTAQSQDQSAQGAAGQNSFQMGATSPHGRPNYVNKAKDMNLHIPAKKRAKFTHQQTQPQSTPTGRQQSSPQAKTAAPETKRTEVKMPTPKPVFPCLEADCDVVFPNDEAREAHLQTEHIQPRNNPLKFFQENLASTLGLDLDGNVLGESNAAGSQSTPQPGALAMSASQSRQGQTPASFAATPMSRGPSMNRSVSGSKAPGSRLGGKVKDEGVKASNGKTGNDNGIRSGPTPDPFANCINPQTLFSGIPGFESVGGGVFTDPNVYLALTPNDTPESSKDSGSSEPNTDVPEFGTVDLDMQWQPLDDGFMMDVTNINMDSLGTGEVGDLEKSLLSDSLHTVPGNDIVWEDNKIDFDKPLIHEDGFYLDPTMQ